MLCYCHVNVVALYYRHVVIIVMVMLGTFMSMLCCVCVVYLGNIDFKIHNGSENSQAENNYTITYHKPRE